MDVGPRWGAVALLLASAYGATADAQASVTLEARTDGCPDERALRAALEREEITVGAGPRVVVVRAGATLEVQLEAGDTPWSRLVEVAVSDCDALADAVAVIVARGLSGVSWEAGVPMGESALAPAAVGAPAARLGSPDETPDPPPSVDEPERGSPMRVRLHGGAVVLESLAPTAVAGGGYVQAQLQLESFVVGMTAAGASLEPLRAGPGSIQLVLVPFGIEAGAAVRPSDLRVAVLARAELELIDARSRGLPRNGGGIGWALRLGAVAEIALTRFAPLDLALRLYTLARVDGQRVIVDGLGTVAQHAPWALGAALLAGVEL